MLRSLKSAFAKRPILGILGSFLIIFLCGSCLIALTALPETRSDPLFPFFTTVSALTVTGLTLVPTNSLSLSTQIIVLILIQIGGLGMMTLFALIWAFLRKRMSLEETTTLRVAFDKETIQNVRSLIRIFVLGSFVFEAIGTAVLFVSFRSSFPDWEALWFALFHSISAFNNAGFYVLPGELQAYSHNGLFMGMMLALVILGGLGFLTYPALGSWLYGRIPGKRSTTYFFSIETRIILIGTALLLLIGTTMMLLFQPSTGGFGERLFTAFFFSASVRTAGFAIADVSSFAPTTLLLLIFFMFVGAAPGSTGGGVKVTTFMLQLLLLRSFLQGREEIVVWRRQIPMILVARSALIIVISLGVIFVGTLALLASEQAPLAHTAFEAFSAFGTVGLSSGAVDAFGSIGRMILMVLMILGRFGPLTLLYLLMRPRATKSSVEFPTAHISLG